MGNLSVVSFTFGVLVWQCYHATQALNMHSNWAVFSGFVCTQILLATMPSLLKNFSKEKKKMQKIILGKTQFTGEEGLNKLTHSTFKSPKTMCINKLQQHTHN